MAFGQQSGPPATHRQVEELAALVLAAGHDGFREARHPLGLTQRQAAGKFTRDEADALIAQLQDEAEAGPPPADEPAPRRAAPRPRATATATTAVERRRAQLARSLRDIPADVLAGELQRRGWAVIEP